MMRTFYYADENKCLGSHPGGVEDCPGDFIDVKDAASYAICGGTVEVKAVADGRPEVYIYPAASAEVVWL